jgi:RHS repeat-associated protein
MCNVDLATGRLSLSAVDFDIPGRVPLLFQRHYRSTNMWEGDLGYAWAHPFGITLWQPEEGGLMFRGADGRRIPFGIPAQKRPLQHPAEQISIHYFSAADLPWSALRSELTSGVFAVQCGGEPTLLFDARPAGKTFHWRGIASRSENLALVTPGSDGLPAEVTDANGRVFYLLRNRAGFLSEIQLGEVSSTASPSTLVRYEYDFNRDLVAVHDSAGTRSYRYRDHLLVGHRDRTGGACQSVFDKEGRCVQTSGPEGIVQHSFTFYPDRRVTEERDSFGNLSVYAYSPTQKIVQTVDPAGGVSNFFYDALDRLVVAADQMGNETAICYGADGAPKGKVRPDGSVVAVETDSLGEVTRMVSPDGVSVALQRDDLGRVVGLTLPAGGKYSFAYAANGDLVAIKLPSGKEGTLTWSPDGRTVTESDAEGVLTEQHFDPFYRLVLVRDALGATTRYTYDDAGYLAAIEHPDGTRRRFHYDAEGRLYALEDEAGHTTQWAFDAGGRLVGVTLPNGQTIAFRYDSENRLVAEEGPGPLQHQLAYDGRGLLIWQRFADGRVERYGFDARGLLIKMTDSSGAAIEVERDAVGLIRRIVYPGGAEKIVEDDPAGHWIRVECEGHVLERKINDKGQVVSDGQDGFVLKRSFSETGRAVAIADAGGRTVRFQYDENDRVAALQTIVPGQEPRTHRFEYDRVGNRIAWFMPSGKIERNTYDLRRRVTEQSVWFGERLVLRRRYEYTPLGQLSAVDDSARGAQQFYYDSLGRLVSVRGPGGHTEDYRYSPAGDLLSGDLDYAPGNRVTATRYHRLFYDDRGFVTKRISAAGVDEFAYLWNGLLREARLADGDQVRYEYDPHYRPLKRTARGRETVYGWNGDQLWFLNEQGSPAMEFVYLPEAISPLEQRIGDRYYSVHTDHVGKIHALIDEDGQISLCNQGGAWGQQSQAEQPADAKCPFGFPGQIRDIDLGVSYNRYRFYFPDAAHFMSPDPIGLWAGIDQYLYPSDPVNFVDPDGLKCRGKTDDPILFRGDRRPPDEICSQGFKPAGPTNNFSLLEHVNGPPPKSNWVSTTHDFDTAERFAGYGSGGPVYVIDNPGCGKEVDCDPDVIEDLRKHGDPNPTDSTITEHEIAFNKAIPPGNIKGFFPKTATGLGPYQACP